jgi:hypothetical protein
MSPEAQEFHKRAIKQTKPSFWFNLLCVLVLLTILVLSWN